MKYLLWIVQILLAVAFVGAGAMKLLTPTAELAQSMVWVNDVPLSRGESALIVPNLVLLLLAAFVAYGRWKVLPIAPKNAS